MSIIKSMWKCGNPGNIKAIVAVAAHAVLFFCSTVDAAVSSAGDIAPVPPSGGGNVSGPFRIGIVDVGFMSIDDGTLLTSTSAAIVGDTETGLGVVTMDGFLSDWTLTTAGADLTVGNDGTGSISLVNAAFLSVNDDLNLAAEPNSLGELLITGLGSIVDVGDDATIAQGGQATVGIFEGGRLVSDANTIGDEATSDGRVTVSDQLSLWRTTSTMTVGDAGRALLQVFDGARVENTAGIVGNLSGSTGTAEVAGLGAIWNNSTSLTVGESGHGTLIIADGGRVNTGGGIHLTTIGNQATGDGHVEVRGLDSRWTVGGSLEVGNFGNGTLRILEGARVTSQSAIVGDNTGSRGDVVVNGDGSAWEINGELNIADPAEAHVEIANGGLIRTSSLTRVAALGRLTLDGGRLDTGGTTALLNTGIIEGNGTIEGLFLNNNAGGQIRPHGPQALILVGTLTNSGLVDIQSGELDVTGPTVNNSDIDARDGAILRFRNTGLDNNSGAQLAISTGVVDVFGLVDNNLGAEITVGGTAVAVFHDAVTNNGTIFVQPGGEALMLENLGFGVGSSLSVELREIGLAGPGSQPSDAFGQVQVGGPATIAGTLEVSLVDGFMPMAGDSFQILTAGGGRSGIFSNEILPTLSGGLAWDVLYNPNSVVLRVISPGLTGDYNDDGVVDAADYVVWRKNVGTTNVLPNDPTGGTIGAAQYNAWRANFGNTGGSGSASAAVPEPASVALTLLAAIGLLTARCRPR